MSQLLSYDFFESSFFRNINQLYFQKFITALSDAEFSAVITRVFSSMEMESKTLEPEKRQLLLNALPSLLRFCASEKMKMLVNAFDPLLSIEERQNYKMAIDRIIDPLLKCWVSDTLYEICVDCVSRHYDWINADLFVSLLSSLHMPPEVSGRDPENLANKNAQRLLYKMFSPMLCGNYWSFSTLKNLIACVLTFITPEDTEAFLHDIERMVNPFFVRIMPNVDPVYAASIMLEEWGSLYKLLYPFHNASIDALFRRQLSEMTRRQGESVFAHAFYYAGAPDEDPLFRNAIRAMSLDYLCELSFELFVSLVDEYLLSNTEIDLLFDRFLKADDDVVVEERSKKIQLLFCKRYIDSLNSFKLDLFFRNQLPLFDLIPHLTLEDLDSIRVAFCKHPAFEGQDLVSASITTPSAPALAEPFIQALSKLLSEIVSKRLFLPPTGLPELATCCVAHIRAPLRLQDAATIPESAVAPNLLMPFHEESSCLLMAKLVYVLINDSNWQDFLKTFLEDDNKLKFLRLLDAFKVVDLKTVFKGAHAVNRVGFFTRANFQKQVQEGQVLSLDDILDYAARYPQRRMAGVLRELGVPIPIISTVRVDLSSVQNKNPL